MAVSAVGIVLVMGAGIRDYLDRQNPEPEIELGTCCDSGAPRRAPTASVPTDLDGGDAASGAATYVALCANCHDEDGSGRRGRPAYPSIRGLGGVTPVGTATVVVHGRGRMPAFGGLIGDGELRDLIAYVTSLPARRPPP